MTITSIGPAPTHSAQGKAVLAQIEPKQVIVPKNKVEETMDPKIQARAETLRVFAGLVGASVTKTDLIEALQAQGKSGKSLTAPDLSAVLLAAGIDATLSQVPSLTDDMWPAIAEMTSGQFVIVLSQKDGVLTLFDKTCPDSKTDVPVAEFEPYFTGEIIRAKTVLKSVTKDILVAPRKDHWFWGQFKNHSRQFGEVVLGSFVSNLLAVAVALFSLQVYDRVIPHQSTATLWVLSIGAFVAITLEALLKFSRSRLMDTSGRKIEIAVQQMLMDRLLGMRSDLRGRSPSSLFSTMREFGSVREFFTASTVGTMADIPFIFVFLLLVASIAGNVVWVLVFGGILMVLPGFFMQRKMIQITQEMQGASSKTSRLLQEALFEADTIKTLRAEDRVRRQWAELMGLSAEKSSDQRRLAATLTFWSQSVQQATYVSAVIAGTFLVFAGEFTVGSIIAVGILTGRTLAPLTQLSATMARWGNVKAALDGLNAIVESEQDVDEERTYLRRETLEGRYELREVTFRYDKDVATQVDIPGAVLNAGEAVAVLGSNGAGKSTLLKMLSGLYAPSTGRILIDGTEMSQIAPKDLRRLIGYLGQDVRLFAGTLRDNLALSIVDQNDEKLFEALDFAGLGQFVKNHPKGLDLEIRDGGVGLSIGQRQSIGWARLWLQDPKICLLDEPTAALDQTLETTLISRLETWLKGRTAIIATHRVPILQLTKRTIILQNGRLAVDGPRDQVLAHIASARKGA